MLDKLMTLIFGSKHERDIKQIAPLVAKINEKEPWAASLGDGDFPVTTAAFRGRVAAGETLDSLLPEAFALCREAARRVLGERAFDVQLMGSIALHSGRIVEMKTGEGKTLMSISAAYLNSLAGQGVHVVTVNDYLAERDAAWMGRVYRFLGVSVGTILNRMDNAARRAAYGCDITYGTNNEFGFDYLRDNMQIDLFQKVQRGFAYCIVDEIDSILIDEARTPLIISGAGEDDTVKYNTVDRFVNLLDEVQKKPNGDYPDEAQDEEVIGDYKLDEKSRRVSFTDGGMLKIEGILQKQKLITGSLFEEDSFEYIHYFTQAVRAHKLYKIDVDYLVNDNQVQIVDEFTGRVLEGRRYGDGLHQAIEAKERIRVAQRNRTLATITFQNFFRMYKKLSGMTGTAETEAVEFDKIYKLDVAVIPTNLPVARLDENDEVYLNEQDKWEAISSEIVEAHKRGQPILVGTISVEKSEHLSALLTRRGIRHEVLNAKNHAREALIIAEAGAKGAVTIATNMAGRGTDIKLGGNPDFRARKRAGTEAAAAQYDAAYKLEKETWQGEYAEVKAAGGLYVIGTERHESRRIDNQLRGRSGRQGDPGRSKFYISLDDDLMRLFGGERMKSLMTKVGMEPGEPIYHPWLTKGIERAQKKVEERNFEIRKHLLDYDDVLNEQRNFIYSQRDAILADENLPQRVYAAAVEAVDEYLADYADAVKKRGGAALAELQDKLKRTFALSADPERLGGGGKADLTDMKTYITGLLDLDIKSKDELAGHESLNLFIRYQYVQVIDRKWLDHLEELESLREAVHLRSYGSKNPLTEYKIDGFNIFYDMIDSIRLEIASRVFRVRIQLGPRQYRPREVALDTSHGELGAFDPALARKGAERGATAQGRQGDSVTVVRTQPKVGRNDPCPCGSGKKYKHCHGR
ncbi:MAG: preprotein translocase subunit SecA [Spirochaetaceae bacterium]|jgi:preprotein translocase subunit SecA|nr:preprotein translocase subunit SecA [Spirochaetaceae bacterium]